ncbi:MAG: hypothetical protein ANABAC_1326 [Anaerolineae bacterium]|nr:MAG: hypothetical protein ANABAC_1326 [Anaerolineae bacterium]
MIGRNTKTSKLREIDPALWNAIAEEIYKAGGPFAQFDQRAIAKKFGITAERVAAVKLRLRGEEIRKREDNING